MNPKHSALFPLFCRIRMATTFHAKLAHYMHTLHQMQIIHRGAYSVDRLQELNDYCRNTSVWRVIAVCCFLPLAVLIPVVSIECIPLQDPYAGWKVNYGAWLRFTIGTMIVSLGFIVQMKQLVPNINLNTIRMISVAFAATLCAVTVQLIIASQWVYPIPFSVEIAVIPYLTLLIGFFLLAIGRKKFLATPALWTLLVRQIYIMAAQGTLGMVYPAFSAVYYMVPSTEKTALVLFLPVIKIFMQTVVAWATTHVEEYMPGITVFSVEVFNALYTTKCMQNADSIATYLAIMMFDVFESVHAVRSLLRETDQFQWLKHAYHSSDPNKTLLQAIVEICHQPSALSHRTSSVIRLRSIKKPRKQDTGNQPAMHKHGLRMIVSAMNEDVFSAESAPKRAACMTGNPTRVSPMDHIEPSVVDIKTDACRIDSLEIILMQRTGSQRHAIAHQALRLLFQCEYLALVEYVECIIPLTYAIYVAIVTQLPGAKYYPETKHLTPKRLEAMLISILLYTVLEMLSFVVLHFITKRKFGISLVHLLAFVLEKQMADFFGRLVVWFVYILGLTLVHFGPLMKCFLCLCLCTL